jgi:hypothetical protein
MDAQWVLSKRMDTLEICALFSLYYFFLYLFSAIAEQYYLAPTWEKLAVNHQDWANTKDFKFAEVDCLLEGDVCDDNDVLSYPNLQL